MRVAALYDIHGNLHALEAALAEVEEIGPDLVLVGGDVVLGPFPRETLDLLDELGERVVFIRGNTDRMLVAPSLEALEAEAAPWAARHEWVRGQLTDQQVERFVRLSDSSVLAVDGLGEVLFCHGSPRSDEEILTRATPVERLDEILAGVEQRVVVCGHTHVQFDRLVGDVRLINAGSVGMPYEDRPGAYWALLGPDVELRRTPFDLDRAAGAIRATEFPEADEFAEEHVLHPASAAEATEHFERMAGD